MNTVISCPPRRLRRQALSLAVGALLAAPGLAIAAGPPPQMGTTAFYYAGSLSGPRGVDFADFNNDGKLDLISINTATNNVAVRLGNGDGLFSGTRNSTAAGAVPTLVTLTGAATAPYHGTVGRLRGAAANLDVVTANFGTNNISVLLGLGTGLFSAAVQFPVGTAPTYIAEGDLNGDTFEDIVTANSGSNDLSILMGDGLGGFAPFPANPLAVGSSTTPYSVAVGDVENDGTLDIVCANRTAGTVSVFHGNGDGTFAVPSHLSVSAAPLTNFPEAVVLADLNGDGLLDIATANNGTGDVSVLINNGGGTFFAATVWPTSNTLLSSLAVADMNNDSLPDIVFTSAVLSGGGKVGVLSGNGDGTFTGAQPVVQVGNGAADVAVFDLNGDLKPDVITADRAANITTIYLNTTPLSVSFYGDTMHITPPPRTTAIGSETWGITTEYTIHYNTLARFNTDPNNGWAIWAKFWPATANVLAVDMAAAQAVPGCRAASGPTLPAWCYRPPLIGEQSKGTSFVYRAFAKKAGPYGNPGLWSNASQPTQFDRP